ncbi:MAG: lamin tail domain-containing protein [Candidatus Gracilibacteria bacterium]|nr:lamin tail domain-containing protein [Candidatus Gracilibacteria bacterium]
MFKKISVLFLIVSFICSNILNIRVFNISYAAGIDLYQQKLSNDTSSAFSNPTDNLAIQPDQYFRFESYLRNNEATTITNVSYYTNFPSDIVYSGTTTAATQVNGVSTYVVPITSFNPPTSIPNYINGLSSLTTGSVYAVRRVLLKFPTNHGVYSNNLSTYFTANSGLTSNTRNSIVYVNVKPHIIDYSFSKSSIVGNGSDSTDLTVKVKDYNGCTNIDGGVITANLSSLGLSSTESLTYDSCDIDGKTAIFKKIGITSLSAVGDKTLSYTDFYAKDEDNNLTDPNDTNTSFGTEDKKTNLVLNIASSNAPVITLGVPSLSKVSTISPYNTSDMSFSSNQVGLYKIALSNCNNTAIRTGSYDTIGANLTYTINSSLLRDGDNTIFVCLTNINGDVGSSNVLITKDTSAPNIYSMGLSPGAVVLNNSTGSIYCSEDGQFRFGVGSNYTSYKTSVKDIKNDDTILNSWLTLGSNTVNAYCKDNVGNESTTSLSITKEALPPAMSSSGLTLIDNDIAWDGVDGRDLKVTWDASIGASYSSFESYRIYVLPENTAFTGTWIGAIYDKNINMWTGSSNIVNDSLGNPLAGGKYITYVAIMGTSLNLGNPASATGTLVSDIVPHPSVLSATFTNTQNLQVKFDAPLKTDLSIHSASGFIFQVAGTTYTGTSISSVSNDTINVTIPNIINTAATGTLNVLTGATWGVPVDGSYNNATGGVLISDSIAPNISNFATGSTAYYQNYYSGSIDFNYTISEALKSGGSTNIQFTRVGGNNDALKTYYITNISNLTTGSHTEHINLASLGLVSGTYYEVRFIAQDLIGNNTISSPVTIKFDNAGPSIVNINPFGPQKVLGILNPTFTWLTSTDDSGNGSGVKGYKLRVYTGNTSYTSWNTCTGSYTEYNITNLLDLSKQATLANLYNYAWGVFAYDNMENIGTTSTCDNFYINNLVPSFSNSSITDTILNTTSYTKGGNNLVIKSTITNSNSSNIWLNASSIKDSSYSNISCSSPVSGVTCNYSANIATYTFSAGALASISSGTKQVQFTAANTSGINTGTTLASITLDNTVPIVASDTLTTPISGTIGGTTTNITWTPSKISDNIGVSYVKLEYSSDGGSNWNLISTGANSGSYPWDISSLTSGSNYKVKISAYDLVGQSDFAIGGTFAIDKIAPTVPSTSITYPSNTGIKLKGGSNVNITWNNAGITDNIGLAANPITLYYSIDGGTNYTQIATNLVNNGTYSWTVPSLNNTTMKIKLEASDNVGNKSFDISDNNFEIDSTAPVLNITYAGNGGNTPQTNKYINNSGIDLSATITDTNLSGGDATYSFYDQTTNTYWNGTTYVGTEVYNTITSLNAASYNLANTINPSITNGDTYKLKIKASDIVGNSFTTTQITYQGDTVNPNVGFINGNTVYSSGTVLIAGTSSDASSGVSAVKLEITNGSNYFDGSSFQGSLTQLATTTSNSYTNWNYNFTIPGIVADGTSINVKSIAYDKAYKTPNFGSGNITVIKDTTGPMISTGVITYPAGGESFRGGQNINITWNTGAISDAVSGIATNSISLEYYNGTAWLPLASGIPNSGSYNWNIATIDYNNAKIRITATDNVGLSTSQLSAGFLVDSLPPHVSNVETMDNDANGQVDGLLVSFSEPIKDNSINTSKFSISNGINITGTATAGITDDNQITLYFTNTGSSNLTPTLTYTSGAVTDFVGNNLIPGNMLSVDKVVPRVQSVQIFDTNANGKLDKIEVVMSEALAASSVNNGWTIDNAYNGMSIASVNTSSNKINLILNESSAFNTATGNLALSLNNSTYSDLAGNLAGNITSTPIEDKASPVLLSSSTSDNNSNYKVDKIDLLFSENIANITQSNLSLSYLSTGSSITSLTGTGTSTLSLNLAETSSDNDSSYKPNVIYSGTSLKDSSNNTTANFNNTVTDGVSPKIISRETLDLNNNGKADAVKISFSENVNGDISSTVAGVNSYNIASYATGSNYIIANVDEKDTIDTSLLLDSKIISNSSLKDSDGNLVLAEVGYSSSTDKMGPVISFARFDGIDKLYLSFSENITNASLIPSNFVLNGSTASIIGVNFGAGTNSAILTLNSANITYATSTISFAINTAIDSLGNKQSNQVFARISPSVVINEVMYSSTQANQYIELRNMGNTSVSMSGWVLQNTANSGTTNISLPAGASIGANGYYLIANSSSAISILSGSITPDLITSSLSLNSISQSNIVLKDSIGTNYDSAVASPWPAGNASQNISMERKNVPGNGTVGTNWYSAVASIGFDDTNPKGTPGSANKIDVTPPVIGSFSPSDNTLFPIGDNINLTYNYSDDIAGVSTGTSNIVIEKYNGASFDIIASRISTSTIDVTSANYTLNHLNFGKYKATFTIDDKAGNTVTQVINFYVDKVEFVVSTGSIDLGSVKANIGKYATVEESITVKTLGAGFNLYNGKSGALSKGLTDIPDYSGATNYGFGFDLYKNEAGVITDYSSIINPINNTIVGNSIKDVSTSDGTQKTYFYKLKYYVKVGDEQAAGNYSTNANFSLILNY